MGRIRTPCGRKTRKRLTVLNFKRNCKCKYHEFYFSNEDEISGRLYNLDTNEVKVKVKEWLQTSGNILPHSKYLCRGCLEIATRKCENESNHHSVKIPFFNYASKQK